MQIGSVVKIATNRISSAAGDSVTTVGGEILLYSVAAGESYISQTTGESSKDNQSKE